MYFLFSVVTLLCFLLTPVGFSNTHVVPDDFSSIQAGIDNASNGDVILVKPGCYFENINFKGKALILKSEKGKDHTFIDGNKASSVVSFENLEGSGAVLDGFTLMNGIGTKVGDYWFGGGVYCLASSPVLRNNAIVNNAAYGWGGGVYCEEGAPQIHNNIISNNLAEWKGGGIFCNKNASPSILRNVIENNKTVASFGSSGAGICCWDNSPALICANRIQGNTAYGSYGGKGGGIRCSFSGPTIVNNIIIDNESDQGGGVYCNHHPIVIENNTIAWNTATESGGGVTIKCGAVSEIHNTIFWNNEAPVGPEVWYGLYQAPTTDLLMSHSLVNGGQLSLHIETDCNLTWGANMIDQDPLFAHEGERDLHLRARSPCIDAGWGKPKSLTAHDMEGDPRINLNEMDIGADEYHPHLYSTQDALPGSWIQIKWIGDPAESQVFLFVGESALEQPINTIWGDFYLSLPLKGVFQMSPIPSHGVLSFPVKIPLEFAGQDIPIQSIVGQKLTNMHTIDLLK